ncbi:MAG: hypothetical protein ACE5G3_09705, partial [Gammaproteobacteria bacterium]
MRTFLARWAIPGHCPVGLKSLVRAALAMTLIGLSTVANAVQVMLITHNQASGSGTVSTLITDGSWVGTSGTNSRPGPTTAVWDWDGTTLTSTG